MIEKKVQERLRYRFTMLDVDGNGFLEAKDFDSLADRAISAIGATASPAVQDAVRAGHRQYWQGLQGALDADADGRVSFEEYSAAVHDGSGAHIGAYAESLAALADRDGDGFIEKVDFTATMAAVGFRNGIDAVFVELDGDKDDRITVAEWVAGIREFYLSDAADARGHQLAQV